MAYQESKYYKSDEEVRELKKACASLKNPTLYIDNEIGNSCAFQYLKKDYNPIHFWDQNKDI